MNHTWLLFGATLALVFAIAVAAEDSNVSSTILIRRNVRDFGAVGDGVHDDTAAFILALTQGKATTFVANASWNASQYNCQTTKPSIVVVPNGTYLLSSLVPLTYYTQLVGDNWNRPTLRFVGRGYHCLDAGQDEGQGHGWYGGVNQDNFYHQLRNVIVDLTECSECVGLHWQVSQATNIVNVEFLLGSPLLNNTGILMECGSGGYFGDVVLRGGLTGMALGNQQFTIRNITIDGATTGILMFWNWVWAFHDIRIRNVDVGISLSNGTGSLSIVDTVIENATTGIVVIENRAGETQLLLDNVRMFRNVSRALFWNGTTTVNASDTQFFAISRTMNGLAEDKSEKNEPLFFGPTAFSPRPAGLLEPQRGDNGTLPKYFGRTRPNYESYVNLSSVLQNFTDVTSALQSALNEYAGAQPIFVPFGSYFLSRTVVIPMGTKLFGEVWTRFAPIGPFFSNASNPLPMFQVGYAGGPKGTVELADLMLQTHGPAPGAILLDWYAAGSAPGDSGIWDVHFRIGGAADSDVNDTICNVNTTMAASPSCVGAHTLFRIRPGASVYVENMWGWTADHDIDTGSSLNMYNARGMVVETTEPVWLYGTAMEHSYLFQYNLYQSAQTLLSIIQTETAYYQPEFLLAPVVAAASGSHSDPLYRLDQMHGYSIYATSVTSTVLYGAGMYSFFYKWKTSGCGADPAYCQDILSVWSTQPWSGVGNATTHRTSWRDPTVRLHNFNTHASEILVSFNLVDVAATNATNGFCDTISQW